MDSVEYYKDLIGSIGNITREGLFENQLCFNEINQFFYDNVYLKKRRAPGKSEDSQNLSSLQHQNPQIKETCSKCSKFYFTLKQNKEYNKMRDILNANYFETAFLNYLTKLGFHVVRGDDESLGHHKGYPDLMVINKTGKSSCYLEIKYNAAPFLKVSNFVSGRECYEGSLTLNPQKLERQVGLLKDEIKIPVFYVYWADFPCVKGIFYTNIMNIWNFYKKIGENKQHDRREGVGDFSYGRKIGQTQIIYPPILEMGNFEELIIELKKLDF